MIQSNAASNLPVENWLTAAAVGGTIAPILLSGAMPTPLKTASLATSVASSAALVAIEWLGRDWKKYRMAQIEIERLKIQDQYHAEESANQAKSEMQYRLALKDWIWQNCPIGSREQFFIAYGVADLALTEIQVEREMLGLSPQSMPEIEAEVIPAPQVQQESVVDAVARMVEQNLDTEWFKKWASENCGIICGQSGDGKSFLLCNVLLKEFLRRNSDETGKLNAKIWICDPDYGSSHGDSPPNTWLGMPLDSVVYTEYKDIYNTVMHVSGEVNRRVQITKLAIANKEPQPIFEPGLLILDELPNIVAGLKDERDDFLDAIKNILRRGKKQNILFKCGTQTLAVGSTHITKEVLQQIEVVMLYSSAQVADNYNNIGVDGDDVKEVLRQIKPLPRRLGDKFVCVTFLNKELRIKGIPSIKAVEVEGATPAQDPVKSKLQQTFETLEDLYKAMSDRLPETFTDTELMSLYLEFSDSRVKQKDWDVMVRLLKEAIANVRVKKAEE